MSDLLDQAVNAVRRLDPAAQAGIARAMLAFAASEGAAPFDFALPGETPTEDEIAALMATVMPSAVPSKAEAAAWNRLSPAEQLKRMRQTLDHPDCNTVCSDTMDDILAEAHRRSGQRRRG